MQKTDGRGGLRSGIRYYVFRYVASGTTSEARWQFGANRLSFKGGTDKRTLQLYIRDGRGYYGIWMGSLSRLWNSRPTMTLRSEAYGGD